MVAGLSFESFDNLERVSEAAPFRRPHEVVDYAALTAQLPPPPEYLTSAYLDDPDTIATKQLDRLRARARTAYEVPFFRRRWDAAGVGPDDLTSLDDLHRFPAYTVDDIRQSIEANPPYGDYQGVTVDQARDEPMRVYMSGGTTGASRPTLYTAWDREAGAILMARALHMQGIEPGDVVINAWAYSTHNGAHAMDEALYRWLNCVVLSTGTGQCDPDPETGRVGRPVRARQGDPHHRRLSPSPR